MHHMKFPPSTDLWVCEHKYSYPDICPECKEKRMDKPVKTNKIHRRVYHINKCSIHGIPRVDICPVCNRQMKSITLTRFKEERLMEAKRAQRRKLFHALTGILKSLNDAKRNNPEAYAEFINKVAIDLPDMLHEANLTQLENLDLLEEYLRNK